MGPRRRLFSPRRSGSTAESANTFDLWGHTMAVAEKTLLEFLLDLLNNHDALAEFRDDPHAALREAGLGDVCVDDIKELLPVVLEKVDADKCAKYEDDCDDDDCWDSEPRHDDGHEHHHHKPIDCDDEGRPAPHCSPTDQVVAHLNYVTNNYSYDSHDTYNTTNNITKIWAGDDADIRVDNTTTNVGDGGTFVGGDNNAPITHGDGNVVGDENQVAGQGANAAFGEGSVFDTGNVNAGDHGGINFGAGVNTVTDASTDNSQHDSNNTDNSDQDNSVDNSQHDSNNVDNSDQDNSTNTDSSIHDNKLLSDNDLSHTDDASHGGEITHSSLLPL
ncbi:IniB N-terminal domain-containing protein [Actinomycetospora termitidis]|uniref:IniB N-terminal domain-containing protein n=1 Tax=Actinomycetospora termitidis TaxID=3053470 RepID=A0ABT7MHG4_9PSEU|nr:IniB N-terminal domain-containing protein [Actinomycetospora sp. Odt1-22]MDL5159317.1 IniB N-terminal domain-containing protein [Actinomycetospora sp. Odt1-22]